MNIILKESLKYALRSKPLIRREIRHVEWLYSLSTDELYHYKEKQFLRVFGKAYQNSTFYNEMYRTHGLAESDVTSLNDISKLPVLTKSMVRSHSADILTVPRWICAAAATSGTTGTVVA